MFWKELNDCLKQFAGGRKVIVMEDINLKVSDESIDEVVDKWGAGILRKN